MAVRLPILTCDGTPRRTKEQQEQTSSGGMRLPDLADSHAQQSENKLTNCLATMPAIALTRSTRIFRTRPQHFVSFFLAIITARIANLPCTRACHYQLFARTYIHTHIHRDKAESARVDQASSATDASNLTRSDRSTDRSRTGKRVGIHAPVTGRGSRISPSQALQLGQARQAHARDKGADTTRADRHVVFAHETFASPRRARQIATVRRCQNCVAVDWLGCAGGLLFLETRRFCMQYYMSPRISRPSTKSRTN